MLIKLLTFQSKYSQAITAAFHILAMDRFIGEPVLAHNKIGGVDEPLWKVFDTSRQTTKYTRRFLRPHLLNRECPMCSAVFVDYMEEKTVPEPESPDGDSEEVEEVYDPRVVLDHEDIDYETESNMSKIGVVN